MTRSHPTILKPIHYENVRHPSDHSNIYFMHLAPDRLLSAVHIRAAASRGMYGFSRHISHSLLYQISRIQIFVFDKRMSYLLQPHMYTFAHKKKKRSCIETPSFTEVCSYPVIGFFQGRHLGSDIWEVILLSALMSLIQAIFYPLLFPWLYTCWKG